MPSLTSYRGLQVVTPDPTGAGGLAIQDDLKSLVDWSPKNVWSQTSNPTVNDDETDDFYPGSMWLRTNVTPPNLFLCESSALGAAVWRQLLIRLVQDSLPTLGENLDVNGKKVVSTSNGAIIFEPNGSGCVGIGTASPTSLLQVAGPIATAITTKSANATISANESIIGCNAAGGNITLTLPSASGIVGRHYTVKKLDSSANMINVDAASSETIDGSASQALTAQYQVLKIVSDGTNWWIV